MQAIDEKAAVHIIYREERIWQKALLP